MTNIIRATWLLHAPFREIFLPRPLSFPKTKLCTKFEVPSSSSFEDMFICMKKKFRGHAPLGKVIYASSRHSTCEATDRSPNNFQDIWDRLPEILGWRDLGHAPLGKIIGATEYRLCTEFKVSSSSSFEVMFDCMPKIEGSRDIGHAPFGENY